MIKFGMDNSIVTFKDRYRIYGGNCPVEEKGLTIGGFESAFLADLVAAYILEKSEDLFSNSIFNKIYRNDGLNIWDSLATTNEICNWLDEFQARVNQLTESEFLQFTCDIWDPDAPEDEIPRNKKVTINRSKHFPYLDMEFFWQNEELKFQVHLKDNQLLKYVNKGSTHTYVCLRAIP